MPTAQRNTRHNRMAKKWKKPLLFLLLIAAILLLNAHFGWSEWISDMENLGFLRTLIQDHLAAAFFLYCLITVFACVLLALPGVTFALLAGVLFGPFLGILACDLACTLGAAIAFLAGRFFLKDAVKPMLEKNRLLSRLLFSGNRKNDVALLMITRLVPLFPYNLQNFAYGVTDMGFWTYTLLTFVFMFPGVSFYTIGAAGLTAGAEAWKYFLTAGVLAVLVTLLGIFVRKRFLTEEGKKQAYVIMTRVPEAGKTKTRLMPFLTGEECKELHEAFLRDMRELFLPETKGKEEAAGTAETDVILYYLASVPESEAQIKRLLPGAARYIPQHGEGMGERMKHIFRQLFAEGYERVVLTGTDIPELTPKLVREAFVALENYDSAISPTADGGYYLLGMRGFQDIFSLKAYGTGSVYEETCRNIREKGLSLWKGPMLSDLDTPEDFKKIRQAYKEAVQEGKQVFWQHTAAWMDRPWEACISCGRCTKNCAFLKKYEIDLKGLAGRPDLFYSCFLCGRCREVCPMDIDGREIALFGRRQEMERPVAEYSSTGKRLPGRREEKKPGKVYAGLLWEKDPYRFANYRHGGTPSLFFPGCNLTGFFPKTVEKLTGFFAERGIGTVYDCCGKPVEELGLSKDGERNLEHLSKRLLKSGCRELILACPNCYYYLRGKLPGEIRLTTVYHKLSELHLGNKLKEVPMPVYLPCPDRKERIFFQDLLPFLPETAETGTFSGLQCCGLGGCAFLREPELAEELAESAMEAGKAAALPEEQEPVLYTYCASCVSQFQRKGFSGARHLLPMILETEEPLPMGAHPFLHRALQTIK